MKLSIPWGPDERLEFQTPPDWELLAAAAPAPAMAAEPLDDELRRALETPHGSKPIRDRDLSGKRVVIVVEDATRPSPTPRMLDVLMGELFRAGVRSSELTLMPGLGVHRPMSPEEISSKYGESAAMVEVVQPDASRAGDYRALGELAPGVPCEIHRAACEADLVVLVGTVEPHIQAGFGGGAKMLVPGVASARCIAAMHVLGSPRKLVRLAGRAPAENPMRRAIDAAAGLMPSEVMTFNAVLNADLNVVRAFAGDPVEAHAAAAGLAAGIYGLDLPGLADVVISGSRPMDRDWRQGVKCFGGPLFAVRPGGVLVAAMRCLEGLGDYRPPFYRPLPRWLVRAAARIPGMRGLLGLLARRGKGLDPENLHMVLYALQMVRRCRVIVCAPSIGREASALMPLFDFTQDMGEALAAAAAHVGRGKARLTVFPYGAVSYPILPGEEEAQ